MPPRRQLPWARKDRGGKQQLKQPQAKRTVPSDIDDDDFFDGTILESSRKGKERAGVEFLDDDLPELPFKFLKTSRRSREPSSGAQMLSSSPPPIAADLPPPETEYMLTGIDKFDLRDDEWMMVEDELLQTAKLFTQHLHLAEYETLKAKIEEQKKVEVARPIIPDAKPSIEGKFKRKAQEQTKAQKKALREVISAREDTSEEDKEPQPTDPKKTTSSYPRARPFATVKAKPLPTSRGISSNSGSDSEDLDMPKRPTIPKPNSISPQPRVGNVSAEKPKPVVKPTPPAKTQTKLARGQRRNLWDDWDELTANPKTSPPEPPAAKPQRLSSSTKTSTTQRPPSPTKSVHTPIMKRTGNGLFARTFDDSDDDLDAPKRTPLAKETSDRLAKRKAEKDRDDKKKPKYDDIPTFLF